MNVKVSAIPLSAKVRLEACRIDVLVKPYIEDTEVSFWHQQKRDTFHREAKSARNRVAVQSLVHLTLHSEAQVALFMQ